jgi:putative ubiquitin-RnfH superfamily antitoxin RatB of RatAB toxin-antitoxin module
VGSALISIQWLELTPQDGGVFTKTLGVLELPKSSTVPHVLQLIGFTQEKISHLLQHRAVAVYGLYATENTLLYDGDRLEILDDLKFDPMESRRRRAQHKVLTKYQKELAKHQRRSRKQVKTDT